MDKSFTDIENDRVYKVRKNLVIIKNVIYSFFCQRLEKYLAYIQMNYLK